MKYALHLCVNLQTTIVLSVSQQQIFLAQDPLHNRSLSVSSILYNYMNSWMHVQIVCTTYSLCVLCMYTVGGTKTVTFPSRSVPFKRKRVPVPFNKKRERNGRLSRRQVVRPTSQTVASSNYTPEESKKAERSTTSVNLLVVDAI